MHKTLQIISFEITRNLKKPSFWIATIFLPIIFFGVLIISGIGGYNTGKGAEEGTDTSELNLSYVDDANFLTSNAFVDDEGEKIEMRKFDNIETALDALESKEVNIVYHIPEDFQKSDEPRVKIYTKLEKNSLLDNFQAPIQTLLKHCTELRIKQIDANILNNQVIFDTVSYADDGHEFNKSELLSKLIPPLAAAVLYYITLITLGNRLTTSMTEEKENRISELLLVSIKPINLIIGKIISLMILGIIQILALVIPIVIIYIFALKNNLIPEEYHLTFNISTILLNFGILIAAYYFFTACSVFVSSFCSTAKDASNYAGIVIVAFIIPIFILNTFTSGNMSPLLYALTYIPFTAPLSIMLRGIYDSIQNYEILIGIADIAISATIITILAAKIFCKNAIGFNSKLNLSGFNKTKKEW